MQMFQEKHVRSEDKRSGRRFGEWAREPREDLGPQQEQLWLGEGSRERGAQPMPTEECGARLGRGWSLGQEV